MRYVQLRAFHHVALEKGFSRAAEVLHLTQPAISDQVRRLEAAYDVLLFNRSKKQVSLTSAGQELLEVTRRLFEAEDQAHELLAESRALRDGHLRIVVDAASHLSRALASFQRTHPGVRITVQSGNSETVLAALRAYEADVGVLGERPRGQGFDTILLGTSPIIACAAAGPEIAGKDTITFAELAHLPLIFREEGSKTRMKLSTAARAAGVELTPAIEAEGREAVREIAASGGGIGFVSQAEFGHDSRLVPIAITPSQGLEMEEVLICLRERRGRRLIRTFFDHAGRTAADD